MATIGLLDQRTVSDFFTRNRRLIAGVGLFVTFWMLVYTFLVYKPSYAAKSVVIIKDSAITSRYVESEQYYAAQTTSSSSSNPVLNTMGILKSGAISGALYRYFAQKHPDQLKKYKIKSLDDWTAFFEDGSAFIKAKNQPGTDLIAIQFSWSDPLIAKEALDVVVQAFQDASRDLNKQEQISRTQFLERQVVDVENQLAAVRKQKSAYQSQKGTVNVDREGNDLAGSRMELANRLNQLESQARGKENMMRRYQTMLNMAPDKALKAAALGQNGSLTKMQDDLYQLQQTYSQLGASLTDTNPKMQEIKAQMDQVRANINAEISRTMGKSAANTPITDGSVVADYTRGKLVDSMLTAQAEAQDLRAQAATIRARLGMIDHQIQTFPTIAEGLYTIQEKEASLSVALDNLRKKALEGRIKEEQTLSNVFIVDAPRLPDSPQAPTRNHLIVLSVMLGAAAGLGAAILKEQLLGSAQEAPAWLQPLASEEDEALAGAEKESLLPTQVAAAAPVRVQPLVAASVARTVPVQGARAQVVAGALGAMLDSLASAVAFQVSAYVTQAADGQALATAKTQSETLSQPLSAGVNGRKLIWENTTSAPMQQPAADAYPSSHPVVVPADVIAAQAPQAWRNAGRQDLPQNTPVVPQSPNASGSNRVRKATPVQAGVLIHQLNQDAGVYAGAAIEGFPALHGAPAPQSATTVAPSSPQTAPAHDAQLNGSPFNPPAETVGNGRAFRGVPGFLLEEAVNRIQEAPADMPPRKQLLNPEDDLLQPVAPLSAPAPENELDQLRDAQAKLYVAQQNGRRSPLKVSALWFRKQPQHSPEAYFGMNRRGGGKRQPVGAGASASAMSQWAQALDNGPAAG